MVAKRKEPCCDLHTHSSYSDGSLRPEELVALAKEANVAAIALCDHNTVAGLPEFMAAAEGSGVEAVPGVEFSTDYLGLDLHVVMLFVQPQHYDLITKRLNEMRQAKAENNQMLVQALRRAGMMVDYEALLAKATDGYINRAHIAAELQRLGYTPSIKEAFATILAPGGGFYTPPKRPDFFETIAFIKSIGGCAVLAHPYLNLDDAQLEVLLPQAVAAGLDAMETRYARYDAETTSKAMATAARFGLLESGGSDFHGANKPDICVGKGQGDLHVPLQILEQLKRHKKVNES